MKKTLARLSHRLSGYDPYTPPLSLMLVGAAMMITSSTLSEFSAYAAGALLGAGAMAILSALYEGHQVDARVKAAPSVALATQSGQGLPSMDQVVVDGPFVLQKSGAEEYFVRVRNMSDRITVKANYAVDAETLQGQKMTFGGIVELRPWEERLIPMLPGGAQDTVPYPAPRINPN